MVSGFDPMWGLPFTRGSRTIVQTYKAPRVRRATLADGTIIRLAFPLKERHSGLHPHEKTLTQDTRFELAFPEPRELEYVKRLVFSLRNLLSLAVAESVNVTKLVGYREPLPGEQPPIGREVEILYEQVENPRATEAPHHHDMIFTLSDFQGAFRK